METLDVCGTVLAAVIGAAAIGAAFVLSIGGAYLLARAALKPVDAVASAVREIGEERPLEVAARGEPQG